MTADHVTSVLNGLDLVRSWQEEFYRDLYAHPELSHQEHRTASNVAVRLRDTGCEVHGRVGGTGVVGSLRNGEGPTVLLRADMDALPVREPTGLPYASTATATDADGTEVPVMHACGHDVHVTCLLGAVALLAGTLDAWNGTVVAVFQHAEEVADGARGTRVGPTLSAADSMRITVHGRGAHGSMPQASVDPVVLAAMIVIRLQTVISREVQPGEPAVLTVGSIQAGTKSNVIPDHAVIALNVRSYHEQTRTEILEAIRRIVTAECEASGSPQPPDFELSDRFPVTENDVLVTEQVSAGSTRILTSAPGPRGGSPRTSRSTTLPTSAPCSNQPLTLAPEPSSSLPSPGSAAPPPARPWVERPGGGSGRSGESRHTRPRGRVIQGTP